MLEFPVYAVTFPTYSDQGQGLSFRAIGRYTAKLSLLRLSSQYQAFNSYNNCVITYALQHSVLRNKSILL